MSSASTRSRSIRAATLTTGCLYLSTNWVKADMSPCLTRSIRAASGSSSAAISATVTNTARATSFQETGGACFQLVLQPEYAADAGIAEENRSQCRLTPDLAAGTGAGPGTGPLQGV